MATIIHKVVDKETEKEYDKDVQKTSGSGEIPNRRYTPRAFGHEPVQFR